MLRIRDRDPAVTSNRTTLDDLAAYIVRPPWMRDALCREYPDLPWVPRSGDDKTATLAVCARCAVRDECRAAGIAGDELGIWGGLTSGARRRLRSGATRPVKPPPEARPKAVAPPRPPPREQGLPNTRREVIAFNAANPTMTHRAIAERFGVSRPAVTIWLRGNQPPPRERGLPDVRRRALAMKADDPSLTHQVIADTIGVNRVTVSRWLLRQAAS